MSSKAKSHQRRVALIIESSRAYVRELIRGIARYNREQPHWLVEFTPRGLNEPLPTWLKGWKGDGILARVSSRYMANALLKKGVPVVDLRRAVSHQRLPSVGPDDAKVAAQVVNYFRQRGFQRFGFVGVPPGTHRVMDARAENFRQLAIESGGEHHEFFIRDVEKGDRRDKQCRQILRWIKKLKQPTAIMACNDDLGLQTLDACRRAGIRVPDEIAVAGVGNDECLCDLALPSLSSVDLNSSQVGYEAAVLLDRMINDPKVSTTEIKIPPRGVVSRMSTDVVATEDTRVANAIVFIRQHACDRIQVTDVLKQVHASRATMEPRFKKILGRTIHQEIQRIRLDRVKELLADTDLPIKQIARQTGFPYQEYLMCVFRKETDQTLKQFRESTRSQRILPKKS